MAMRVILLVDRILKPVVFSEMYRMFVCFRSKQPPVGQVILIHEVF